jgi:hypothetical protein
MVARHSGVRSVGAVMLSHRAVLHPLGYETRLPVLRKMMAAFLAGATIGWVEERESEFDDFEFEEVRPRCHR